MFACIFKRCDFLLKSWLNNFFNTNLQFTVAYKLFINQNIYYYCCMTINYFNKQLQHNLYFLTVSYKNGFRSKL